VTSDAELRKLAEGAVTLCEVRWHTLQNPVDVWAAIEEITKYDLDVPGWVREYLQQIAARILDGQQTDQAIGLSVKGGPGKLKQWHDSKSRISALGMCIEEAESGRHSSWESVFEYVAKEKGVDADLLRKWWYANYPGNLKWYEKPVLP